MGWSIGYDSTWDRDIGYGVPAYCDHPGCGMEIERGLGYVCGGGPYGSPDGCGLFFCSKHLFPRLCERCEAESSEPFAPTPDHPRWIRFKLHDTSWQEWRDANPAKVAKLRQVQTSSTGERV